MRSCRKGGKRKWRKWREWWREDCTTSGITVNICWRHWTEKRQLFLHALAGIQHHRNLFATACFAQKHELLQSDDTGSWSRLEVIFYSIMFEEVFANEAFLTDSHLRPGNGPTAIIYTHSLAKRKNQHCESHQHNHQRLRRHYLCFSICRYHYWLLYRLPEFPDPELPPGNQLIAPVGKFPCFQHPWVTWVWNW